MFFGSTVGLLRDDDGRIDGDILENGQAAQIHNLFEVRRFQQIIAQFLAIIRAHEFIGGDEAEIPVGAQQFVRALIKIDIQIGAPMIAAVSPPRVFLELRRERLLADIGRVADDDIEAAAGTNLREFPFPVELGVEQAIAMADVGDFRQLFAAFDGAEPEVEAGHGDRLRVQIDAEEVFAEDVLVALGVILQGWVVLA